MCQVLLPTSLMIINYGLTRVTFTIKSLMMFFDKVIFQMLRINKIAWFFLWLMQKFEIHEILHTQYCHL